MLHMGLLTEEAEVGQICASDLNHDVYEKLKRYTDDQDLLFASLMMNPFGESSIQHQKLLDKPVKQILTNLNRIQDMDEEAVESFGKFKKAAILYFVNCLALLENSAHAKDTKKWLNRKRAAYSSKLLSRLDISELKYNLEDKFFKILEPEVFENYLSLLKYTKKHYFESQKKYAEQLRQLFVKHRIEADIQSRLKTLYSIHKKIEQKNILFSQVLDTIGLRVITNTVDDCYRAMGIILNHYPSLMGRIKDYIAIPKENGYRSIHMTIIHNGHPTEIQIRTWSMHEQAQYGKAGHVNYKIYKP